MHQILEKYNYSSLTWTQFKNEINYATHDQYNWFFDQWFKTTHIPEWDLTWTQEENQLQILLTQIDPAFKVRVPLVIIGEKRQRKDTALFIDKLRNNITLPVSFRVRQVIDDPAFTILHWSTEYRSLKPTWAAYSRAFDQMESNNFKTADSLLLSALDQVKTDNDFGAKFLLYLGLGQSSLGQNQYKSAIEYLQKTVHSKVTIQELMPWVYYNLAKAYKAEGDTTSLKWAVSKTEQSETMIGKYIGAAKAAKELFK